MELKRLQMFVAAAEASSFRQAAERGCTQTSSVSRTVAALEQELGVSLFARSTRGVRLTAVGQVFLTDARRIFADVDRVPEAAQSIAAGVTGQLR